MVKEVNIPVYTIPVDSETHFEIGETPLTDNLFAQQHIPELSLGIISDRDVIYPFDALVTEKLPSHKHGRSAEYIFKNMQIAAWEDKYGNLYSSRTSKGNTYVHPQISIRVDGYAIEGFQLSKNLERIGKGSQLLCEAFIDTEAIPRITIPKIIYYNGALLTQEELKQQLIGEYLAREDLNFEEQADLKKYFAEVIFVNIQRDMQVPERPWDWLECPDKDAFLTMLERGFNFVNFDETREIKNETRKKVKPQVIDFVPFDITNEADIHRFIIEYLPQRAAWNIAHMHNKGLWHGFLHNGNSSQVSSIYDLDSLKGKSLDLNSKYDRPITSQDIYKDIIDYLSKFDGMTFVIEQLVELEFIHADPDKKAKVQHELICEFSRSFFRKYITEASSNFEVIMFAEDISILFDMDMETEPKLLEKCLENIEAQWGIQYQYQPDISELIPSILAEISTRVQRLYEAALIETDSLETKQQKFEHALGKAYRHPYTDMALFDYLLDRITLDIQNKHKSLLKIITQKYREKGIKENTIDTVINWFAARELSRVITQISPDMYEAMDVKAKRRDDELKEKYFGKAT